MGSYFSQHSCDTTHNFKSFHEIKANDIDGNEVDFSIYKDKVVIICNVASEWGKKRQIPAFNNLYEKYHSRGLEIMFFPCNQFNGQEPGDKEELKKYYQEEMKIPFTLMEKTDVQGDNICDAYKFLRSAKLSNQNQKGKSNNIEWNYQKYVINKNGQVIKRYGPSVKPEAFEEEGRMNVWLDI